MATLQLLPLGYFPKLFILLVERESSVAEYVIVSMKYLQLNKYTCKMHCTHSIGFG